MKVQHWGGFSDIFDLEVALGLEFGNRFGTAWHDASSGNSYI